VSVVPQGTSLALAKKGSIIKKLRQIIKIVILINLFISLLIIITKQITKANTNRFLLFGQILV